MARYFWDNLRINRITGEIERQPVSSLTCDTRDYIRFAKRISIVDARNTNAFHRYFSYSGGVRVQVPYGSFQSVYVIMSDDDDDVISNAVV